MFFKREKEKKEKNSTQARWMSETQDHDQRNLDQNTVKCINPLSSVNKTQSFSFNMKAFTLLKLISKSFTSIRSLPYLNRWSQEYVKSDAVAITAGLNKSVIVLPVKRPSKANC